LLLGNIVDKEVPRRYQRRQPGKLHLYSFWLDVPKLSNLCWESMNQQIPGFSEMDEDQLGKFGIPKKIVSKLCDEY
jgi:hypothetical protein